VKFVCCVVREVPQEAPVIVSTSATSTSVHVRWTSPFFVGAPLIGYRLSLAAADDASDRPDGRRTDTVMEVLVSSDTAAQRVMSEVVTLLRSDTDYMVSVAALNQFGAGVPATVTVRTLPHIAREFCTEWWPELNDTTSHFLLVTN